MRFYANTDNINLKKFENDRYSVVNFISSLESSAFINFFTKNPKKIYKKYFLQKNRNQSSYRFNSNVFQGNLWKVFTKNNKEFDLYITPDSNSSQLGHWFLFEFKSHQFQCNRVTFNIRNLSSPYDELQDLELMIASATYCENRTGIYKDIKSFSDLNFNRNIRVNSLKKNKSDLDYTLTFDASIERNKNYVFSFDRPVERQRVKSFYLSLNKSISLQPDKIQRRKSFDNKIKVRKIHYGKSLLKVNLFYLKISKKNKRKVKKKAIVISQGFIPSDVSTLFFIEEF